jgi:hypothetical protein
MKFDVPTSLSVDAQKRELEKAASGLVDEYLASYRWLSDGSIELVFNEPSKAAGIVATASPGSGRVAVNVDLPLKFRLFSSKIEDAIKERLGKALAGGPDAEGPGIFSRIGSSFSDSAKKAAEGVKSFGGPLASGSSSGSAYVKPVAIAAAVVGGLWLLLRRR